MDNSIHADIESVLFDAATIAEAVAAIGGKINRDYAGRNPVLITVLRGGLVFLADLIRAVDLPLSIDFMAVSSYGAQSDTGVVQVLKDLDESITGRDVVMVEDVIDTGLTLNYLMRILSARQPASLKVCALLDKSVRRIANIEIDYKGFDLPDIFVVGYGLDIGGLYRNLPYIGMPKEEIVSGQK